VQLLTRRMVLPFACLALAVGVAACGSSNSSSSSTAASSGSGATTTTSTSTSTSSSGVNTAAPSAAIQPYIGHPSAFPITRPLKSVKKGATIAFMDCGTSICSLFWELLQPAAKVMGVKLTHYEAGSSATSVTQAYDSVVSAKPDAVIATATNVDLWKNQLKQLQAMHIPVVTTGILGTKPYGITAAQAAETASVLEGKLMADYTAAKFSSVTNIALYEVPELSFTPLVAQAYQTELKNVCSNCTVRVVQIPIAAMGSTAPSQIVSDLQSHSGTKLAVFAIDELESGLPAALANAGIKIDTLGDSPGPAELEYLKQGKETAVLGVDLPVLGWTLLDQAMRQIVRQPLVGEEANGISDLQFLTQSDIMFDPSKGWTGYPDFAQRFAKLWGVGG
jgi:ribose transport system substrate-binding protein